jgi:type III secretion system FlhB-like substrate exporter
VEDEKGTMISEAELDRVVRSASLVLVSPGILAGAEPLAIAFRYDEDTMDAPVVSSKTWKSTARYVMRMAIDAGVCVLESRLVWRLQAVEVGEEVPLDLYGSVAEFLALARSTRRCRNGRQTPEGKLQDYEIANWMSRHLCKDNGDGSR